MKKNFYNVILDLSEGSAYEFNKDSEIPTIIKYGRCYSGKFQTGKIKGNFNNIKLHNIIYLIKRGYDISEITNRIKDL